MGRGLAVPAALPVPTARACMCSAGTSVWLYGFPSSLEEVSLTLYISKVLPCSLPSSKALQASPSEHPAFRPSRTEGRLSAKSLGFHRFPLATRSSLGVAAALSCSSQSLFSMPLHPIGSRGTFHVSHHMAHSRQLARDGTYVVNSLFLLTDLRVPFYSFQCYSVSLSSS